MNRLAVPALVLLLAAVSGPARDAAAQTDASPLAHRTSPESRSTLSHPHGRSDDDAPSGLSAETWALMQRLEAQSLTRPVRLRLGEGLGRETPSALPAGAYRARRLLFTADSVYWLAPGRTPTPQRAPLWRLQRITSQNRKRGALVGSAFGSLVGLAVGAVAIQVTGQTNEQGASIGPGLGAIPVGAALGALAGYLRGSRRRHTFDDLPAPPPPLPPPHDRLARLEGEIERVRMERGMLTDRVGELELSLWELEDRVGEERRASAARVRLVHDSLRLRLGRLESDRRAVPRPPSTRTAAPPSSRPMTTDVARGSEVAPEQRFKLLSRNGGGEPTYGIVVASLPRREDALDVAERLEELLLHYDGRYTAAVLPSEDLQTYRAVFGPFGSAGAARQALATLADVLPVREGSGMGRLKVLVKPWGTIYIDGELRQRETDVPYATSLVSGAYRVRATHPTLGTWERVVDVGAGEEAAVVMDFNAPSASSVSSTPLPRSQHGSATLIPHDAWVTRLP